MKLEPLEKAKISIKLSLLTQQSPLLSSKKSYLGHFLAVLSQFWVKTA